MSLVDQVTQRNASASEELASTAEEMAAQAESLQQTIAFFNTGATYVAPAARPARPVELPAFHNPRVLPTETVNRAGASSSYSDYAHF